MRKTWWARAYSEGVSMGSDLIADGSKAPSFIVWATRDAKSAGLQRIQIVKGWTKGRRTQRNRLRCFLFRWGQGRPGNQPLPGQWRKGRFERLLHHLRCWRSRTQVCLDRPRLRSLGPRVLLCAGP